MSMAAQKMVSRLGVSAVMVGLLKQSPHRTVRLWGGRRLTKSEKLLPGTFAGLREGGEQPGAGHGPVALGRGRRDAEDSGGLLQRQTRKVAQLDDLGLDRLLGGQSAEGLIQGQQVF